MYKIGDKFIVEIDEVFKGRTTYGKDEQGRYEHNERLYRIKGLNSLVFDENGLNKLQKYKDIDELKIFQNGYDSAKAEGDYNRGLNDAWEAARKIDTDRDLENYVFGEDLDNGYHNLSVFDAISKIKSYEEQKKAEKEIKVGDEVRSSLYDIGVVTRIYSNTCAVTYADGLNGTIALSDIVKTGRHFDIERILKEMSGEVEE